MLCAVIILFSTSCTAIILFSTSRAAIILFSTSCAAIILFSTLNTHCNCSPWTRVHSFALDRLGNSVERLNMIWFWPILVCSFWWPKKKSMQHHSDIRWTSCIHLFSFSPIFRGNTGDLAFLLYFWEIDCFNLLLKVLQIFPLKRLHWLRTSCFCSYNFSAATKKD